MPISNLVSDSMVGVAVRKVLVNIGIAAATILIVFSLLFAYSSVWPPLVVVESSSMQHSDSKSFIGVIDAGDIVIVKRTRGEKIITYVEAIERGHMTYGEYGDVIIYKKGENSLSTPIIHRAICRIIYNATGGGFDIPSLSSLPEWRWKVLPQGERVWWNIQTAVEIYGVGYLNVTVRLDLRGILQYFESRNMTPHGGFITMGDHNVISNNGVLYGYYDQISIFREPVRDDWVIGIARGEIPWFGLLKLWAGGGAPSDVPENSKTNLFITIAAIIVVPIGIDALNLVLRRKGIEIFGWTKKFNPRRLFKKSESEKPPNAQNVTNKDNKTVEMKIDKDKKRTRAPIMIDENQEQRGKKKKRGNSGSREK